MFSSLIYQIFSQLAVGGLIAVLLVPPSAGKSFFRFCGITCLILLILALWAGPYPLALVGDFLTSASTGHALSLTLLILTGALALGFVIAVVAERQPLQKPLLAGAGLLGAAGILIDGFHGVPVDMPAFAPLLGALYSLVSALFLGSVIFAMILGHWYLVVPTLPIHPLRSLTLAVVVTTLLKVLLAGLTFYLFWTAGGLQAREVLRSFFGVGGIFFWTRVLFGLIGPTAVAYMTWETVKINSTQSATGLLYVATIFVLIGETTSRYIFYTTSIPL